MKKQQIFSTFKIITILFIIKSCSLFQAPPSKKIIKSQEYEVLLDKEGWAKIPSKDSDYTLQSNDSQSLIIINSLCERYKESSIGFLSQNLLSGIQDSKIIHRKEMSVSGAESVEIHARGQFEGTDVELMVTTIKHNECIYDFVIIFNNKEFIESDKRDYREIRDSIRFISKE